MRTASLALVLALAACNNHGGRTDETTPAASPTAEPAAPAAPADDDPEAPPLDGAVAWLGVDAPIDLKSLRGQVVLLDFWTYCCINCMHVLPILRDLEREFAGQPLAVIGVHSAKFDGERDPQRIREAMRRYGVEHPVAVDSEMAIWRRYGVSSWPSLVVIKPNGRVAGVAPGEPDPNLLRAAIRGLMAEARADGSLGDRQILGPAAIAGPEGQLAYPGKVIALPDGGLAVSDSGHHRVLVLDRDGKVRAAAGSGLRGWSDGSFAAATFDDPQGLAVSADGRTLYVADTRNHVIRRLDLRARTVATIAGTGALGEAPLLDPAPTAARETALRSPWDLALAPDGKRLYVALAGSHQLAVLDLGTGKIRRLAGSGRERIDDGDAERASFSQPSGLALVGGALYVADSEVSGVRAVAITDGLTRTIAGTGLFDFGDRDGPVAQALLQHPLHVLAVDRGKALIVADTYNNKLRRIDLQAGEVTTFYRGDGELALHEPAGLTREKSGSFVVADTNAGRLLRIAADGKSAAPIVITGAEPPLRGAALAPAAGPAPPILARAQIEGDALRPAPVDLQLQFVAPPGHEFSEGSPFDLDLVFSPSTRTRTSFHGAADGGPEFAIGARLDLGLGDDQQKTTTLPTEIVIELRAVACDAVNHSYCTPLRGRYALDLPPGSGPGAPAGKQTALARVPVQLPPAK
jgi:sugar lactone lactonase YvrE/cytochrome oxidase Cu insertion factor (SCO1/SenC/PrrC family)